MTPPAFLLRQDWVGELLFAAQSSAAGDNGMDQISLQLGQRWMTLKADSEEAQLHLSPGPVETEDSRSTTDLLRSDPFARFVHSPLYSWWLMENENGIQDGLLLLFDRTEGVLIVAQPGWLEILAVSRPNPGRST